MTTSEEKMREAFEAHQLSRYQYADISRDTDGRYWNDPMESEWETWQAALKFVNTNSESEAGAVYECPKCGAEMEISMTATPSSGYFLIAPQYAQAIETAAIMKCGEMCANAKVHGTGSPNIDAVHNGAIDDCIKAILALIPPDGQTQLEEFGMKVAAATYNEHPKKPEQTLSEWFRAIVTNLIGVPPLSSETEKGGGK